MPQFSHSLKEAMFNKNGVIIITFKSKHMAHMFTLKLNFKI